MGKTDTRSKPERGFSLTARQWWQVAVVLVLLLGAGAYGGYRWLQGWRYDRAIRDTQDFLRLGDPRSAAFAAKRAVQVRANSAEAARMLAEALEKTNSTEAVIWRKKVVELAPQDWRDQVAFAATAMRFRDPHLARTALEKVDAAGREQIDYHRTAADVAMALNDNPLAETHLARVVELDPYDTERRLQLAAIRLSSPETEKAVLARTQLEELKSDPQLRLVVLRVLVRESSRENKKPSLRLALSATGPVTESPLVNDPRLADLALELLGEENATVDDCLVSLEILRLMRQPDVQSKLVRLETAKFQRPAEVGDAMMWLNLRGFREQSRGWAERMPEELRTTPEVQLALADAWILDDEWGVAQAIVEETDWGDFEAERLVISAIAWRIFDDEGRATASWKLAALRLAQDAVRIRRAADFCARWRIEPEMEKLWWVLATCPGDQNVVLKKLFELCVKRKDGAGLYRAVKGLHALNPNDSPSMNNYAWLSLLRKEDLETAHRLAEQVHAAHPQVGAYASTYAYSLHLRGKTKEAVAILDGLSSSVLKDPTVAGCYGFLLLAAGEKERAQEYLGVARRSPDLLPEESQLFLANRERIDRSLEVPELRIFSSEP